MSPIALSPPQMCRSAVASRPSAEAWRRRQSGSMITYTAFVLTGLLVFAGLAVDAGMAYLVKAQLSKAVDGAALAAARALNSGAPKEEAVRIFRANLAAGDLGTTALTDPATDPDFYSLQTTVDGVNVVTVQASATIPTTFMRLANVESVTVRSRGEARRRLVDLSLVLDVSSSIGGRWPAVRDAARAFVNGFDGNQDRVSLISFV
jgi:Flp pilus assembly protein TadG